jgi:chromate reductase, NAD(P)H dehydrogenase (quinone)
MSAPLRIVGISGSLRRASCNTALLRAAAALAPSDVSFNILDVSGLPLYNGDLEASGAIPPAGACPAWVPSQTCEHTYTCSRLLAHSPPSRCANPCAAVTAFREAVQSSDAVLFASPEYNYGLSGALKNAIDWGWVGCT